MFTTPEIIRETTQSSRLDEVLPGWLHRVPLYQGAAYAKFANDNTISAEQRLRRLPFITKNELRRDFPRNFLGEDTDLETLTEQNQIELERTSGTSEEQVSLLLPRGWWSAQEEKALRLNAFVAKTLDEFPSARRVTINSPVCNADINYATVPAREERIVGNALFVSLSRFPFLWDEAELERIATEAAEWQPVFLDVDSVYGVVLARFCERRGIRLPSLRFIICSYEFVSVTHRRILERAFGVPVFNLYGGTETGHLLMENEDGEMIPSSQTAFLEVVETDSRGIGELIVTTLTNDFMPLIRYRIRDLVERYEQPYHTTYLVHGRERDALTASDGSRVTTWDVDQCFTETSGIAHYQLLQTDGVEWQLRFVPDGAGPTKGDLAELTKRLSQKLGITSRLEIEQTDLLLAESSGKFRLVYPSPAP